MSSRRVSWYPNPVTASAGIRTQSPHQLVSEPSPRIRWYPNQVTASAGIRTQSPHQLVSEPSPRISWYPNPVPASAGIRTKSPHQLVCEPTLPSPQPLSPQLPILLASSDYLSQAPTALLTLYFTSDYIASTLFFATWVGFVDLNGPLWTLSSQWLFYLLFPCTLQAVSSSG